MTSYPKHPCCIYCGWIVGPAGSYHGSVRGYGELTSHSAKQATLEEVHQRHQGFGELYLSGVDHLPYTNEYTYTVVMKLKHSRAAIRVEGTTPPIFARELEDNDNNSNGNNDDSSTDNDDVEPDENFIEDEG
jgi:hypothetical protein